MRTPLSENQIIELALVSDAMNKRTFKILKAIGKGASCFAYKAIETTDKIPVIIKECFPYNTAVRDADGTLLWSPPESEKQARERFIKSFNMQLKIQSADETMNTAAHLIDGLRTCNNTLYSVTGIQGAKSYDSVTDTTLQEIFETARATARAIGRYHTQGILHLDIKPQNILVFPDDTRDIVKVVDFDSMIYMEDVTDTRESLSYTNEYAAPELLQGRRSKICEATDVYSIGAVVFSRIMLRVPTADDRGTFSDWDFSDNPLFCRLSNKTHRLTKEFFRKTLSASTCARYQSAAELIEMLDTLIEESNPKRRHLNSICPISRNYFTGRNIELNEIHTSFMAGKSVVFLHGIGGIGKTELALHYAEKYKDQYDVVAFGRFNDTLENMFCRTDFISVENNAEGEISLDTIKSLVDEHTLLVIDNFDLETDPSMDSVLALNCKLLLTSRLSFEELYSNDSRIKHISIEELALLEQIKLFENEYKQNLSKDEQKTVRQILKDIDGYTLLIPLIAKAYKKDDFTLYDIQQKIHNAGIKWASNIKIRHHKDRDIANSLYGILCEVLDIGTLSDDEVCVMRNMSLLEGVQINRKWFNALFDGAHKNSVISLVEKGWIQLHGSDVTAELSLHRVIGELIRDKLKPDLENCPEIRNYILKNSYILSTNKYIYDEIDGYVESEAHKKLEIYSFYRMTVAIFRNCDFTSKAVCVFWLNIIYNIIDSTYDNNELTEDFIIKFESCISDQELNKYPSECQYKFYVIKMIWELKHKGSNILLYAEKANNSYYSTQAEPEYDFIDEADDGDMHFNICSSIHKHIRLLDSENNEYWDEIPKFDDLCKFISEIWPWSQRQTNEHIYNDFVKRTSQNYYKLRLNAIKKYEFDEAPEFDEKQYEEKYGSFDSEVMAGLDGDARWDYLSKKYPDEYNNKYEDMSDDDDLLILEGEDLDELKYNTIHEVIEMLKFNPYDPFLSPFEIKSSWSETYRDFYARRIIEIENSVFWEHLGLDDDVEIIFSCVYLLVDEYEKCKHHLERLLISYEVTLSKSNRTHEIGQASIQKLPGFEILFDTYFDIIPTDLALWFIGEIINIAEYINLERKKDNNALLNMYKKAKVLSKSSGNSDKEAFYKEKIKKATGGKN